jgi:hypothetical protein
MVNPQIPRRNPRPSQHPTLIRKTLPHPQSPQQHLLKHILRQMPIPHDRKRPRNHTWSRIQQSFD